LYNESVNKCNQTKLSLLKDESDYITNVLCRPTSNVYQYGMNRISPIFSQFKENKVEGLKYKQHKILLHTEDIHE
jgi:hypothetical protein